MLFYLNLSSSFRDSAKRRLSSKGKKKRDLYKGAKFERKKDDFLGNIFKYNNEFYTFISKQKMWRFSSINISQCQI